MRADLWRRGRAELCVVCSQNWVLPVWEHISVPFSAPLHHAPSPPRIQVGTQRRVQPSICFLLVPCIRLLRRGPCCSPVGRGDVHVQQICIQSMQATSKEEATSTAEGVSAGGETTYQGLCVLKGGRAGEWVHMPARVRTGYRGMAQEGGLALSPVQAADASLGERLSHSDQVCCCCCLLPLP